MDPGVLEARLAALEERVDELSRRLFSDLAPLRPAPVAQTTVGADLVELAAKGGDVPGQFNLAMRYFNGDGVAADPAAEKARDACRNQLSASSASCCKSAS